MTIPTINAARIAAGTTRNTDSEGSVLPAERDGDGSVESGDDGCWVGLEVALIVGV